MRKSIRRKSPMRKSPKRKSIRRKSPKRKSIRRKSPKRKSPIRLLKLYKSSSFDEHIDNCIDNNFYKCYEKNLEKIDEQIRNTSGKHAINKERADYFINNQKSVERRQAAADLINNTIYITLQETKDIIGELIDKIYDIDSVKESNNIYFFVEKPNKSYYFLNIIALYFIKTKNLKRPIFIKELSNDFLENIGTDPLIILDDVSYSGSQMSQLIGNIYYNMVVKNKKPHPNIIVALTAVNTESLKRLQLVPTRKLGNRVAGLTIASGKSPFKILYLENRLYKTLVETVGKERSAYILLFFSLHTNESGLKLTEPVVSIYLDHKIADMVSTYLKALVYAPIIPSNYKSQYIKYFGEEIILKINSIPFISILEDKNFDIIDLPTNDEIEFHPFINTCSNNQELNSIINNKSVKNMDYILFIADDSALSSMSDGNSFMSLYLRNENINKETTISLIEYVNNYRCPKSFYKKAGLFDC